MKQGDTYSLTNGRTFVAVKAVDGYMCCYLCDMHHRGCENNSMYPLCDGIWFKEVNDGVSGTKMGTPADVHNSNVNR